MAAWNIAVQSASKVAMKTPEYLWDGFLMKGKFHLLAGEPGAGKTTLALTIAAAVSKRSAMPDGIPAPQGGS